MPLTLHQRPFNPSTIRPSSCVLHASSLSSPKTKAHRPSSYKVTFSISPSRPSLLPNFLRTPCLRFFSLIFPLTLFSVSSSFATTASQLPDFSVVSDISDAGLELHVVSVPQTPVVAIRVYVLGGVYGENERRGSGIAFCLQELLLDAWQQIRLADPTSALAQISASLDYDALCFSALTTRDHYPAVLRQLGDLLARFSISEDAWQRVRDRVSRQLLLDLSDYTYQLLNLFLRTAYAWHPLRTPLRGEHALFADLSRDDLTAFYRQYVVAGNILVVIAGDCNPVEAANTARDAFALLPQQSVSLPPAYQEPPQANERWIERRADVTQSFVCVGYLTAPEGHPDDAALDLLARLLTRERDQILPALGHPRFPVSDFTISRFSPSRCRSALLFTYRQDPRAASSSARALAAWLHQRALQPWLPDDIHAEVEALLATFRLQLADPAAIASTVGHACLRFGNPYFPRTLAQRWQALSPKDISRVAKTYFSPTFLTTALIQPYDTLSENDKISYSEVQLIPPLSYPIRRVVLDNGLTLLLRPNHHEPLVHIRFAALGGGWCENQELPGLFAFLGSLMCDAPHGYSPASYSRQCRAIHLSPQFLVSPQHFTLFADVSPTHTEAALSILCDAWGRPQFSPDAQERALTRLRQLLLAQSTNLPALADMLVRASLFNLQPYGLNWLGTPDSISRFTWRDAQQAWRQFCVPAASTLLVSGDFDDTHIESIIRNATRRWLFPKVSEFFFETDKRFAFHSEPPTMTVLLPPEPTPTTTVTRVYSSLNPLSLVACGSIAPGLNSTNFPPYLHNLARAALALALDDLHRTLLDPDGLPILKYYAANAWAGYDVGWLYAWIAVPPQFTSDASRRLQALFHSTLRDLANSPALPAARARAIFDAQLALHSRNTLFDLIIQNYLFGYDKRLPLSYQTYLTNISPPQLSTFYSLYARFPVTIIVTPQ